MNRYNLLGSIIYIPRGLGFIKLRIVHKKQAEASPSERCLLNKLDSRCYLVSSLNVFSASPFFAKYSIIL